MTGGSPSLPRSRRTVVFTVVVNGSAASSQTRSSSAGPADWLLRITPAAAFSVQQAMPRYAQVSNVYTPAQGFFPLTPWAGLAVLYGWAALALGLAVLALRRADA